MKFLTFRGGRAGFEERSCFPVASASIIASAFRESLSQAFGAPVDVRLFEPVLPSVEAWAVIASGASLYRLHGTRADAVLVLRAPDALAIAAAAFGEFGGAERALSVLERSVLERILSAGVRACASICGAQSAILTPVERLDRCTTYFEILLVRPVVARIGIALAREPLDEAERSLELDDLEDIRLECVVRTDGVAVPAGELAGLEIGCIVPITEQTGVLTAVLSLAGRPLARGECGVRGNRLALAIGLAPTSDGSAEPES